MKNIYGWFLLAATATHAQPTYHEDTDLNSTNVSFSGDYAPAQVTAEDRPAAELSSAQADLNRFINSLDEVVDYASAHPSTFNITGAQELLRTANAVPANTVAIRTFFTRHDIRSYTDWMADDITDRNMDIVETLFILFMGLGATLWVAARVLVTARKI